MSSLKIQYVAYAPDGIRLGILPYPLSAKSADVMNDLGSGTLDYLADAPQSKYLENLCEVAVEIHNGTDWVEPGTRLLRLGRSASTIEETKTRRYTLPSYGMMCAKIRMFREELLDDNGDRPFAGITAGTFLKTLIDESKGRGNVPGLLYSFTTATDSAGVSWGGNMPARSLRYGDDLLTQLRSMADEGLIDWTFVGRELRVYVAEGLGTTRSVTLTTIDINEAPDTEDGSEMAGRIGVVGDNGRIYEAIAPSVGPWGLWEELATASGVQDIGGLQLIGQVEQERRSAPRVQMTRQLQVTAAQYLPHIHYGVGDTITASNDRGIPSPLRVRQITLTTDRDGAGANLVLNDRFIERSIRQGRTVKGLMGSATSSLGTGGTPTSDDTRSPKFPIGLVVNSAGLWNTDGAAMSQLSASWAAVTEATDSSAIDVDQYEVYSRLSTEPTTASKLLTATSATTITDSPYEPTTVRFVKVRARSRAGVWGAFSSEVQVTMAAPLTPLDPPSDSVPTQKLGVVTIPWDGKLGANFPPAQFAYVYVGMSSSQAGAYSPVGQSLGHAGAVTVTGIAAGQTRWFKLYSVDRQGVVSAPSTAKSITVKSIDFTDLDQSVQDAVAAAQADATAAAGTAGTALSDAAGALQAAQDAAQDAVTKSDAAKAAAIAAAAADAQAKADAAKAAATATAATDAKSKADAAQAAAIATAATAAQLKADGAQSAAIAAAATDAQTKADAAKTAAQAAAAADATAKADAAKAAATATAAADATAKANAATAVANTAQSTADTAKTNAAAAATAAANAQTTANNAATAASTAQSAADVAMLSADQKTTIIRSVNDPSGVAADGDLWWKYSGSRVIGQWRWGGAGTPHAATSSKRDAFGQVITNLATNPSFETASGTVTVRTNLSPAPIADVPRWSSGFGTGGAGTRTIVADARFPGGVGNKVTWTTLPSATAGLFIAQTAATVVVGSTYMLSTHYAVENWPGFVPAFYAPGGTLSPVVVEDLGGGLFRLSAKWVSTSATTIQANLAPASLPPSFSATYSAGGAMVELSPVLSPFFYWGTPTVGDFAYASVGAQNNSPSIQTAPGIAMSGNRLASVQSQEWASSGVKSLRQIPMDATNPDAYSKIPFGFQAGKVYTILAKCRIGPGGHTSSEPRARSIHFYHDGITDRTSSSPATPGVYEHRLVVTITSTGGTFEPRLYNGATAGGGDVWWDDLCIVEGVYDGPAFTGDSPGAWWGVPGWGAETIDGLILANLDAGKITTGFLDVANRVAAESIVAAKLKAGDGSFEKLSLGARQTGGVTTERVPAPLTDSAFWARVIDGTWALATGGSGNARVAAGASGIVFTPTAGAFANLCLTARKPAPSSRQVYLSSTSSTGIEFVVWQFNAAGANHVTVYPAAEKTNLLLDDLTVTYQVELRRAAAATVSTVVDAHVFEVIGVRTGQQSVNVSPQGVEAIDDSGNASIRLGTWDSNFLSIYQLNALGQPITQATIDDDGVGTFSTVKSAGDVSVLGTPLVGTFAGAQVNGGVTSLPMLDRLGRGTQFIGNLGSVGLSNSSTEQGFGSATTELPAGRLYKVVLDFVGLAQWNSGSLNGSLSVEVWIGSSPQDLLNPNGTHLAWQILDQSIANGVFQQFSVPPSPPVALPSGKVYILVRAHLPSARTYTIFAGGSTGPCLIFIEDSGPDTGLVNAGDISTRATAGSPPPPPAQRTQYFDAFWSEAHDSGGNTLAAGGSLYADGRMVQGGGTGGARVSYIGFPPLNLSSNQILSMRIRLRNRHTSSSAGATVQFGANGLGGAPGALVAASNRWDDHTAKGEDKWYGIPSSLYASFQSGALRCITLGDRSSGASGNYGIFDSVSDSNALGGGAVNPALEITYR